MTYRRHKEAYLIQHRNAKKRGIPWHFNYITWWRKWCESGKWGFRGKNVCIKNGEYKFAW